MFLRDKENRSSSYQFSIEALNDPHLDALKQKVREDNDNNEQKHYVQVRPRGPRFGSNHTLKENARYFDVYIQTRYQ